MDENNKNLRQTNPLKIVANTENTFSDIKESLRNQLKFPVKKQLIIFNGSTQLDKSTLNQAACEFAAKFKDGKEMYIYLMVESEFSCVERIANEIGYYIFEERNKCQEPLTDIIRIPPPSQEFGARKKDDMVTSPSGGMWSCDKCTFTNEARILNCAVCEEPRH